MIAAVGAEGEQELFRLQPVSPPPARREKALEIINGTETKVQRQNLDTENGILLFSMHGIRTRRYAGL